MKICLTFILSLSMIHFANSQPLKQLKIGDPVPNIVLHDMVNYPKESLQFADLRGRFVLLDFWHTGCPSCIEAMPELEKLQTSYANHLKIIMVNFQSTKIVRQFILKQKQVIGRHITLTIASNDNKLNAL